MIVNTKKAALRKMLLSLFVIILLITSFAPAYAGTVEIAYMTPHYRHPVTGVIEDSGQNEGIGQGMTESVLFPQALVETDDQGRIYITTRNKLAQHITSMKFAVQKRGGKGYTPVSYQVTKTGADFKDTRFQIPSKNSIIRMEFYVEPMGRTVIFYGSMGKLVRGNTDFKVFVNTNTASGVVQNVQPSSTGNAQSAAVPVLTDLPESSETGVADDDGNTQSPLQNTMEAGKTIGFDHGLLTKNSPEIKALLGNGDDKKDMRKSDAPYGEMTKFMLHVLAVIIGILVSALVLCAVAMPICYKLLKDRNIRREEMLYAKEERFKKMQNDCK